MTTRYRLLLKSGKIKWVHLRFYSKFDTNGIPVHLYGTIQDITEMKKVEDELEKYSQHLEQLVEEKVQEISSSQMATIYALIKLSESRDDDTGSHIERTASFCRLLAQKIQFIPQYADVVTGTFIETIYKASPLHDIGKVGIPDSILIKPGKLTDEEFAVMKTHVQIGYDTLSKVGQQYDRNEFLRMGMDIALYHHEKWNGGGYNNGLKGDEIPYLLGLWHFLMFTTHFAPSEFIKMPFRTKRSMEIIISSQGSHFDPALVDVFNRYQDEFESLYESIK